jgi:hypothetical protein
MMYVFALPVATFWMYEKHGLSYFFPVAHSHAGLPQAFFSTMAPLRLAAMVRLRCI